MKLKTGSLPLIVSCLAIGAQAFAIPYHRMSPSTHKVVAANCVFPDGTSPARGSEQHCYDPKTFLHAYGIDQLHAQGLTGKGQTIILVDSFGSPTLQNDLDHFSDVYGLPHTTIQFIYPNGPVINDMSSDDKEGWAGETTLDLEWAHAIAPDATLVNVVTNTSETVGLAGLPDMFNGIQMAIQKYPGAIISMSFGTGEPTFTADDISTYLKGSFHQIFADAGKADVTLLASSGDSGSTNEDADQKNLIPSPNASYPASDSYVTAVGGTALQAGWKWTPEGTADDYFACKFSGKPCPKDFLASSVDSTYRGETVWKEDWAFAAGGGGVSTIFDAPAYQANVNAGALKIMNGHRGIPDVSMNAAINGGVNIYTSYGAGPSWQSTGGTSCASPETAALIALAGQKASDTLGRHVGIGYLNPILYSLSQADFNDIVSEKLSSTVTIDNDALYYSAATFAMFPKNVPPVATAGYFTTPGYDLATGLGTPKAEKLVLDIAKARVARESSHLMP